MGDADIDYFVGAWADGGGDLSLYSFGGSY
jgi:hypothetical protein